LTSLPGAKGVFAMIFFLGCDVCKSKLDVSLVNEQGIEQWYDIIPNDAAELAGFLLTLQGSYPEDEVHCVVESTACYHYPLLEAATAAGMPCRVINPIITRQQIKATVRGKKTDRTDALMIARLGLRGEGRLYVSEPYTAAKALVRSVQKLGQLNGSFARHETHLTGQAQAELSLVATELLDGIRTAIADARKQLYQELGVSVQGETFRVLQTIPGIGPYVAASIIGELQTMERFVKANRLVAYAGLDLRVKQSGHTLNSTGHLTKRGSSYLRRSLFIAASVARQYDPYFKSIYDKKRNEGKSYTTATIAVARKLLLIVRRIWLSGEGYDVEIATRG
jgi:transposase